MSTIKTSFFLMILSISIYTYGQETLLYETINYRNAVKNGTRSRDGNPGPNYWQNHADYDISVRMDTSEKKIYGTEHVTYYNNSKDTIISLVLRLYQDKYKKGAIRDMLINPDNISDGMILDSLVINGKEITIDNNSTWMNGTNLLIWNFDPLYPNSKLDLYCKWSYNIPSAVDFRRTGQYKDDSYFIGYFYPQIAVYDDIENFPIIKGGWDFYLHHMGIQEFYNDFNNFHVTIEIPEGFYVWATGDVVNPENNYPKKILERLGRAKSSETPISIIAKDDIGKYKPISTTWEFKATSVPDFAFGTAPNYIWEGVAANVGESSIFVDVIYPQESNYYPNIIKVAKETIEYYSNEFPGVKYPYSHSTTFNGMIEGGMEFPMIANNQEGPDTLMFYHTTSHEIIHNYTPFMMGMNEKRYQFMDEGFTAFFTDYFLKEKYKMETMGFGMGDVMNVYNVLGAFDDYPLINSFSQVNSINLTHYFIIKPYLAILYFSEMVGTDKFQIAFKEFVIRWQGKHPTPWDMFYTFNDILKENYNWYWKAWYFDLGHPDLSIELIETDLLIKRVGEGSLPLPIKLVVEKINGEFEVIEKPLSIWKNGDKQISISLSELENIRSIKIDAESVPDVDLTNNVIDLVP